MSKLIILSPIFVILISGTLVSLSPSLLRSAFPPDNSVSADRIVLPNGPIHSITFFGENEDGYLIATYRKNPKKKHLHKDVGRTEWNELINAKDVFKAYKEKFFETGDKSSPFVAMY